MMTSLKQITTLIRRYHIDIVFGVIIIFWLSIVNYNSQHHISLNQNLFTGELTLKKGGIHFSAPWVLSTRIDTRPFRVCLDCGCKNISCKLVSFNPDGWEDFVNREGFKYYWFTNRLSFNFGYDHEYRGIKSILKGYTDGNKYSFINVSDDL